MFLCRFQIFAIESLVSLGTSTLVLVVMPQFDVLTNLFISGGVCIVSAILQIIYRLQRETWKIVFPICSLILTVAGNSLYTLYKEYSCTSNQERGEGGRRLQFVILFLIPHSNSLTSLRNTAINDQLLLH